MQFNSNVCDLFKASSKHLDQVFYHGGWLAAFRDHETFNIKAHVKDIDIVNKIRRLICKKLGLIVKDKQCGFVFKCKKIGRDISFMEDYIRSLGKDDNYFLEFCKGLMEARATCLPNGKLLFDLSLDLIEDVLNKLGVTFRNENSFLVVDHSLDMLHLLYGTARSKSRLFKWFEWLKKKTYDCVTVPTTTICPKTYLTDAGNDVVATKVAKKMGSNTWLLETETSVCIPDGYWGMLVPRSSLSKSGFVMTNSLGVIDSSYRGKIKIALTKVESEAELTLPFRCAQLIIVKQVLPYFVARNTQAATMRGNNGYGSTST